MHLISVHSSDKLLTEGSRTLGKTMIPDILFTLNVQHLCRYSQNNQPCTYLVKFKSLRPWGPFLERPGNLTGPESDFDIKVSRKVGRVLTFDEVHFLSLADNFTEQFSNLLKLPVEWKTKQLNGPGNYRELRETGPRAGLFKARLS